jgi:hypothetical protein
MSIETGGKKRRCGEKRALSMHTQKKTYDEYKTIFFVFLKGK